jgi:hypothetical protein
MTQLDEKLSAEELTTELKNYPQEFQDWLRRKVSVLELATLAAGFEQSRDKTLVMDRTIQILYASWKILKHE